MSNNRHLGARKREPVPYTGNILYAYQERGRTNGWKGAQPNDKMPPYSDPTPKTRRVEVTITRTQTATVIIEVLNASENDASTEARYFLQRNQHLLDNVTDWSEPTAFGYGRPTTASGEPLARFCMREEYARRRDLHQNAVRIPLTFENIEDMEGKP